MVRINSTSAKSQIETMLCVSAALEVIETREACKDVIHARMAFAYYQKALAFTKDGITDDIYQQLTLLDKTQIMEEAKACAKPGKGLCLNKKQKEFIII
jgi:hypothetical protein